MTTTDAVTITTYADDTYLTSSWFGYVAGRAMCPDGTIRNLKRISASADTGFSVPASVTFRGRTVSGYVVVETRDGFSTVDDPGVVKFRPYLYGVNGHLFNKEG